VDPDEVVGVLLYVVYIGMGLFGVNLRLLIACDIIYVLNKWLFEKKKKFLFKITI
jgi:hypothetical protein